MKLLIFICTGCAYKNNHLFVPVRFEINLILSIVHTSLNWAIAS